MRRVAGNIALEGLVSIQRNGRPTARLAESWSVSDDGRLLRIRLPASLKFHSGRPATAEVVRKILQEKAPAAMGPAFDDILEIRATSDRDLEFALRQRSTFVLERLDDIAIEDPDSPLSGTGPFYVSDQGGEIEMRANTGYHGGPPLIDQINIKAYRSLRSAWADMLRGQVDMLYDVSADALDSLASSSQVKILPFPRGYAYLLLFNMRKPELKDARVRRQLNAAVDREALVSDAFRGHSTPAAAALSPQHWAYSPDLPHFRYSPQPLEGTAPRRLKCLLAEPSLERLALMVQRQLQAIGVDLELELAPADQVVARLESGDFDTVLSDFYLGPTLARAYLFWHSRGPSNYGHYNNTQVDASLDAIRHAADDSAYRAGVAVFEQAIVDDPPGLFLTWGERARAVSNRFDVPSAADTALFGALHLWRPAGPESMARRN